MCLLITFYLWFIYFNDAVHTSTIPRCALFDPGNPILTPCKIKNKVYSIETRISQTHLCCEYLAKNINCELESDENTVVLQFVPIKYSSDFLIGYGKQLSIWERFGVRCDVFNMVLYLDHSTLLDGDVYIVMVQRHYAEGSLQDFASKYRHVLNKEEDFVHEVVAIESWCGVMGQIRVPLQEFGFGKVTMDNIFVAANLNNERYDFSLGRIEDQYVEYFSSESISKLVMVGWEYYSRICNKQITIDIFGESTMQTNCTNVFCVDSQIFWENHDKEKNVNAREAEKKKILQKSLTLSGQIMWMATLEFNMNYFIAQYALLDAVNVVNKTWLHFCADLYDICAVIRKLSTE